MIDQRGDSVVITGRPLLGEVYRAVLLGIAHRRANGVPSRDLQAAAQALYRAHMSPPRHELATAAGDQPRWNGQDRSDLVSVAEAAVILQLSKRQVQRLAKSPGGLGAVRVGHAWMLAKAPVLALAAERRARDRTNGLSG